MASSLDPDVETWLKDLYSPELVPTDLYQPEHFETLKTLQTQYDRFVTQDLEKYKTLLHEGTKQYELEVSSLSKELLGISITHDRLGDIRDIRELSHLAGCLGLSNVEDSSFLMALSDLTLEREEQVSEHAQQIVLSEAVQRDTRTALQINSQLKDLHMTITGTASQKEKDKQTKAAQIQFYRNKAEQYKDRTAKFSQHLPYINSELSHDALSKSRKQSEKLKSSLVRFEDKLKVYEELPPDKDLALVKLEVARANLKELEEELSRKLNI